MQNTMISILKNFSENPAGRYVTDGPNSGERFREELLLPALRSSSKVVVDLDGALGFGSSFLEEAFGGLVRAGIKASELHSRLEILTKTSMYKSRIWHYIDDASKLRFGAGK